MENYEQKYKEAIERCKSWIRGEHPECFTEAQKAGEFIFPELRESEDERIRKGLIEHLKELKEQSVEGSYLKRPEHYDAWITWLEKQGEQKLIIIIPKFKVGDIIKPKPYNEEHLIKDINENGYILDVDIIIPFKDEDVWEIVEQKPTWSEEDEKMYQSIIDDTVQKYLLDGNQFAWLKSIKDRVQPQPKQEWSEEDELMLESTIQSLRLTNGAAQMKIDWLKSLKPNHWKPSEEEIEALNDVRHLNPGLDSLYWKLKKS